MYSKQLIDATLTLFSAVPIKTKRTKKLSKETLKNCVENGVIVSPHVNFNYEDFTQIFDKFGLTPKEINNTFHKSWDKVATAPLEQLYIEQIMHYITTYGFEKLGVYDSKTIYIPNEELDIPELKGDRSFFRVVNGLTEEVLKERVKKLISIPVALSTESLHAITIIIKETSLKDDAKELLEVVKNKEASMVLYIELGMLPKNPEEFLRYLVYRATNKTLLIKDKITLEALSRYNCYTFLKEYIIRYGYPALGRIFNRFKPIFMALKNDETAAYINKISKWSKKVHEPLKEDYLNTITAKIKNGSKIERKELKDKLSEATVFRKIKLLYALKHRKNSPESVVYKVRNGKGYATTIGNLAKGSDYDSAYSVVLDSIVKDVSKKVKDKTVKINEDIEYALPNSEKQFAGNVPFGTSVSCDKDMVFGIYWRNQKACSIDLDLSLIDLDGSKLGWDGDYRNGDSSIVFSGDITDAPKGATELYYVKKQANGLQLVCLNDYRNMDFPVEYKTVIGKKQMETLENNYMLDPNDTIASFPSSIPKKYKTLGIVKTTSKRCSFYFYETENSNSITSRGNEVSTRTLEFINDMYINSISFNNLLEKAGAKIVSEGECDIDLSMESISKDSFLSLLG